MPLRPVELLLVEDDRELAEMIEQCVQDVLPVNVTHVSSVDDALREELTTRHDIIVASLALPETDGLSLVRELRVCNRGPMILTAEDPTVDEAIEAMQLRVTDLLARPFDLARLAESVREAAQRARARRRLHRRHRRLRRVCSRIIRERRDLRQRMDLICQDVVHAYRRLAHQVTDTGTLTEHVDD